MAHEGQCSRPTVQIVPLWNWNSSDILSSLYRLRFKLYLYGIEIKCKIRDIRQYCRFKLYLYGIEIYIWIFRKIAVLFKLYLYGIEMQVFWCADLMPSVQIVPLWNWNWFSTFIIMRFKNVQIVPLWNWNTLWVCMVWKISLVQIVPLWNWNIFFRSLFCALESSNCTFMELKCLKLMKLIIKRRFKLYLYGIEIAESAKLLQLLG